MLHYDNILPVYMLIFCNIRCKWGKTGRAV